MNVGAWLCGDRHSWNAPPDLQLPPRRRRRVTHTNRPRFFCATVLLSAAVLGLAAAAFAKQTGPRHLLVYWSESPWPTIWTAWPDGSHRRRVIASRQNAKRPRLSPDRRWIAFDGAAPGKPVMRDFEIQIVHPNGKSLRVLTSTTDWDHDAEWSPDGRTIAFTRMPPDHEDASISSIWVIGIDGKGLRKLAEGWWARWSPDGTQLVYSVGDAGELHVVSLDGGTPTRLDAPLNATPADWGSRGILFTTSEANGASRMWVVNPDGSRLRRLGRGFAQRWSPNGARVLYSLSFTGPLFVMDANGLHKRRILNVSAAEADWR
jgi:Tol biopolymer transport system component